MFTQKKNYNAKHCLIYCFEFFRENFSIFNRMHTFKNVFDSINENQNNVQLFQK